VKKQQVDHVLRASGKIAGDDQFIIVGSQSKGWKARLVNLPAGDTEGVRGLCLDPHDLAISKYVARREKDIVFTRELARRGYLDQQVLLARVADTPVSETIRARMLQHIAHDFRTPAFGFERDTGRRRS